MGNVGVSIGYSLSIVLVPISIIVSLVSLIKERKLLSVIVFLISLLPIVVILATFIGEAIEDKRNMITEEELLGAYEKISGKQPLCLLNEYDHTYLLYVARIDSDTIGDGDLLMQYEEAHLGAKNYQLKKLNADINDWRKIGIVHYIPYKDSYKVRYYIQYQCHYKYENKSYYKISETDDVVYSPYEWQDESYKDIRYTNLLKYYEEHQSEIPVIAEEKIKMRKAHVKFEIQDDKYVLKFKISREYYDFNVIVKYLKEHYHAEVFEECDSISSGYRMAPVKIGNSIMELRSASLFGPLSDRPLMEQIAEDFETYAVSNNLVSIKKD